MLQGEGLLFLVGAALTALAALAQLGTTLAVTKP